MKYDSTGAAVGFGFLAAVFTPWVLAFYALRVLQEGLEDIQEDLQAMSEQDEETLTEPLGPDSVYVDADQLFDLRNRRN